MCEVRIRLSWLTLIAALAVTTAIPLGVGCTSGRVVDAETSEFGGGPTDGAGAEAQSGVDAEGDGGLTGDVDRPVCVPGGPVTSTYSGGADAVTCWFVQYTAYWADITGLSQGQEPYRQIVISIHQPDSQCAPQSGLVIPLTSPCVDIEGQIWREPTPLGTSTEYSITSMTTAGLSATGTLTINRWPEDAGQDLSVTFSADAALVAGGNGGDLSGLAPISGSVSVAGP
jgi:hypothetical protein